MKLPDLDTPPVLPADFERHALGFIEAFCQQTEQRPCCNVRLSVYRTRSAYQVVCGYPLSKPTHIVLRNGVLTIHLCLEGLEDIPQPALLGLLDLEMAYALSRIRKKSSAFNFQRLILPLFPVAGSAAQVMRLLVEHLKTGLNWYFAAQTLIEINRTNSQVYYYFWKIRSEPDEVSHYQELKAHNWLRAVFLARKLEEIMPVALLADLGMASELASFWWDCHAYLLPHDRDLLLEQTATPARRAHVAYADIIVDMFQVIKVRLLL